jgi:hypothetical protein
MGPSASAGFSLVSAEVIDQGRSKLSSFLVQTAIPMRFGTSCIENGAFCCTP